MANNKYSLVPNVLFTTIWPANGGEQVRNAAVGAEPLVGFKWKTERQRGLLATDCGAGKNTQILWRVFPEPRRDLL